MVYIKASTTTLKLIPNFITYLDVILLSDFSIYTWDPHMNSMKKKNRCTNHNVTLNHVVILGMELGAFIDFLHKVHIYSLISISLH